MNNNIKNEDKVVEHQTEKEINLRQLYIVIKRRFWIVILSTVLFTALGSYYVSIPTTPLYESSTRIYLQADKDLFNTVRVIMREPVVLDEVIKGLNLNRSAEGLRGQISVETVESSTVLRLSVIDSNPVLAAEIANAVVTAYQEVARGTVFYSDIIVLTEAQINENLQPINPTSNRALYIAIIAGFLIGIGIAFILDSLDDAIKSEREIEEMLGITVLGNVSKMKRKHITKKLNKQRNLSVRGETIGS